MSIRKIELLAPAGDLEKLKTSIDYGADAVYFGGENFSLRAGAGNLSREEMLAGVEYVHRHNKKAHLALNIFPHNYDIDALYEYLYSIRDMGIDAFIASDPGTISMIKEVIDEAEIHLSTQANMTNYKTAQFWSEQGVKRVVLARELSIEEIKIMNENIPEAMEMEAFVHGAMCISYSGRCLLSNYMINRDANKGECAHPCRWKYDLVEKERPEQSFPIEEDERGTYIMNSKDLCMIEHLEDLYAANIASIKLEGRMKSVFYVATVVNVYRKALEQLYESIAKGEKYIFDRKHMEELKKVSHRDFTTGFYYSKADESAQNYESNAYIKDYVFLGIVRDYDNNSKTATIEQRNKMIEGDRIEVFGPGRDFFAQDITEMYDEEDQKIKAAPHAQQIVKMKMLQDVAPGFILRKEK